MILRFLDQGENRQMAVLLKELGGLSLGGRWSGKVMSPIGINPYNAAEWPEAH